MIWVIVILVSMSIGFLLGFVVERIDTEARCPDRSYHEWEYVGETEKDCKRWDEGDSYHLPGEITYKEMFNVYRCKKCGKIKHRIK
jgi:hypothetical protein